MTTAAERLEKILKEVPVKLKKITDKSAGEKTLIGKWSKKEVLGHLIDSAANNHQRFVRMQIDNDLELLQYKQNEWVELQHYNERKWTDLINLWLVYNQHLVHVMKSMDNFKLSNAGHFPEYGRKTLQFLVDDYVDHMEHHLKEILP